MQAWQPPNETSEPRERSSRQNGLLEMVDLLPFRGARTRSVSHGNGGTSFPTFSVASNAVMCQVHLECLVDVWKIDSFLQMGTLSKAEEDLLGACSTTWFVIC